MSDPASSRSFELKFEERSLQSLRYRAAPVPWDSSLFGRDVFEIGEIEADVAARDEVVVRSLRELPAQLGAAMCYVRVPTQAARESALLQQAGYLFVEYSFLLKNKDVQALPVDENGMQLRRAIAAEEDVLAEIAHDAFEYERLIRDSRFPISLVRRRYELWLRNSMRSDIDAVFVPDIPGAPKGFAVVRGGPSEWHVALAAISPAAKGSGLGRQMYSSVARQLKSSGCLVATTRVSANHPVGLRLWEYQGFRMYEAQQVYHWVSPQHGLALSPVNPS